MKTAIVLGGRIPYNQVSLDTTARDIVLINHHATFPTLNNIKEKNGPEGITT